ncbi:Alpha-1,3-galactosidase B precursor [Candidatus Ornithobacterium hominis]|uniref:right-handed parallel beta-helix repeat-containing protein n=1 Tax=Candidatus Ornithobacterium hominis TaxID=2497989 RepID=UPI000E872483|nr:right-handed parallel beta-helix repeat-containing protein [Candidatus Ornithobacterium hominis]SZD71873.1 Alpha-1,3-galactosidase B precursor [Candidatus Ornithobacterium hominis]
MMRLHSLVFLLPFLFILGCRSNVSSPGEERIISFETFGIQPNSKKNASIFAKKLIDSLQKIPANEGVKVIFPKGRYDFYATGSFTREYYISNHDQLNPKNVAFALENLENITIDGQGSEFIFHGRMIPFSIIKGENISLQNFSIDFENPAFRQLTILAVDENKGEVTASVFPENNHVIENHKFYRTGESYELNLFQAMPFRADRRLAYQRSDVAFNPKEIEEISPNQLRIKGWYQIPLTSVGERFALRSHKRPTPGVFISQSKNTAVDNIQLHYAEGMGLLAQMSENIFLDGFSVALKGKDDPRYFTTQADATHFSACKGVIVSKNGLYEGMADDAINVHGTYLKIIKRLDAKTVQAQYMHPQAWGFVWGEKGDEVQFLESEKMELLGDNFTTKIASIYAVDQPRAFGAKVFEITFENEIPKEINEKGKFSVENLTWTPEVIFSNNVIRNNRARGALFSTPKKVICENNVFDHTHGTAILLCGDSNGWYETGACREVVIRNNQFINALTSNYQFTNAIISIYPEIPNLEGQEKFFHSGIVIENNTFETFDQPILYAKSTDGIVFRNNVITHSDEFEPFHWNKHRFFFEKVKNVLIEKNQFENGFNPEKDVRIELSEEKGIQIK